MSIIIPAYNEQRHLKACLDSIADQTIKPDEVIVVDNNSSDATAKIAGEYPFVTIVHESRQGVVFARDRGFNTTKCSLIGRIDADTVLPPDWVERVKRFYQKREHASQALTGGCYFYNVRFKRFAGWWQGQIAFRANRLLLGHHILYGSNMILPRHIWRAVKKDVCHDKEIHEDLDLAIHLNRHGYDINYKESLRVGVKMRRVHSNRNELWANMMLWPKTLQKHGKKTWVLGWVGAVLLYIGFPVVIITEHIARLAARPPIDK